MDNDEHTRSASENAAQGSGDIGDDPGTFLGELAEKMAEEQRLLRASLASGEVEPAGSRADLATKLDDLQFEVKELRGMLESLRTSLDSLNGSDAE